MALAIVEANTVSRKYFDKTMTQNVYEDSAVLYKLKDNRAITVDGGTSIQFPVRYRKFARADAVGPHEQVTFEQKVTRTGGDIAWKYYNCDNMISWDERVKNSGKEKIVNLLADKADEIREDMMDRFATDLYTTNPNGLGFISLPVIVGTDTYAGILIADVPEWQSTEDTTTTELVLYGANSLSYFVNAATFGKNSPTLHMTTRDLASKFESLIEPQKRYKEKTLADAGFTNTTFHGVPVVGDAFCVAKMWLGLDIKQLELRYHKDFNFDVSDWQDLFQAGFPRAMGKVMSWAGNMTCRMRRSSFKATALDYTI